MCAKDLFRSIDRRSDAARPARPDSQWLAIEALRFFAGAPDQAQRFFAWSGLDAASVRSAAADPGFALGILDYFAQNLASLERFCEAASLDPGDVIGLHERLRTQGLTSHDEL